MTHVLQFFLQFTKSNNMASNLCVKSIAKIGYEIPLYRFADSFRLLSLFFIFSYGSKEILTFTFFHFSKKTFFVVGEHNIA